MSRFMQQYATPLITGLFLVSLVSGIALFFHLGGALFHGMHEWLSMVLIAPFLLHIWKNWRSMKRYFFNTPMYIALVLSLAAALFFAVPSLSQDSQGNGGGNPFMAITQKVLTQPAATVAPILGTTSDDLLKRLARQGYDVTDPKLALSEIAGKSGKNDRALLAILLN